MLIASDLLHEDYAYMFEAFWDLWVVAENGEWNLRPSPVKLEAVRRGIPVLQPVKVRLPESIETGIEIRTSRVE